MLAGKKIIEEEGSVEERADEARSSAQILARAGESSWSTGLSSSWCPFTNWNEKDIKRMSRRDSICIKMSCSGPTASWGVKYWRDW